MSYWYNVTKGQVEDDAHRSQGAQVMGPYETEADAAKALDTARERTQKWDDEDREWGARGAGGAPSQGDEDLED